MEKGCVRLAAPSRFKLLPLERETERDEMSLRFLAGQKKGGEKDYGFRGRSPSRRRGNSFHAN